MSGEISSREALTTNEFIRLPKETTDNFPSFKDWTLDNLDRVKAVSGDVRDAHEKKWNKFYICGNESDIAYPAGVAPAVIKELTKSDPPLPQESGDVEYYRQEEFAIGKRVSTIDYVLEEIADVPANHTGEWIERCMGRNSESGKMMVARVAARRINVRPEQVMMYNGSVVMDKNAVHSETVSIGGQRYIYSFDRFFVWEGKEYSRCCYIPDRVHQAGLLFETYSDKEKRKDLPRLRKLEGTQPKYTIIGLKNKEQDVRDLKRLYERYYLKRKDSKPDEDPVWDQMLSGINPIN